MSNSVEVRSPTGLKEVLRTVIQNQEYARKSVLTLIAERMGSYIRFILLQEFGSILDGPTSIKLIDVRPATEFGICHLPNSTSKMLHLSMVYSF